MTDRDHFAAAALTGLMTGLTMFDLDVVAKQSYDIADAMLRERERVAEPMTKDKRAEVSPTPPSEVYA